jgi:hypothetical protein
MTKSEYSHLIDQLRDQFDYERTVTQLKAFYQNTKKKLKKNASTAAVASTGGEVAEAVVCLEGMTLSSDA